MAQTVKALRGDMIMAADGRIGLVDDVYFDDERWGVRYFVVDTGGWLPGKRVLISPASVDGEASGGDQLRVRLTREQVEKAPDAESDRPVSRQYEMKHAAHFGYPYYGGAEEAPEGGDSHLRSGLEVIGYDIEARDGAIGDVEDFVVDEKSWSISDVVVDTTKWWPGGRVRVHPDDVERIDWEGRKVHLRLTRDEVRRRPGA